MAEKTDKDIADVFVLEEIFPEPIELFDAHTPISAADENVLIALDTNALLLPYQIKAGNLKALKEVYERLSKQKRIFLPDRVVREFVRNRDTKLADLINALEDRKSRELPASDMPPILESLSAFVDAKKSRDDLSEARRKYADAISTLIVEIKKWRADDPIVRMYSDILKQAIVSMPTDAEKRKELLKEWLWRLRNKVAPGYKDAPKDDLGIGDFLVWKALLFLGETHKKSLAFVTGEQKADWFARASGVGVYPKPELLDEYRRVSGGKSLRLMSLYELLGEMDVPGAVVQDVKIAEDTANTAISFSSSLGANVSDRSVAGRMRGKVSFDYSTNDGKIVVGEGAAEFVLRFSKASDTSIRLYRDGTNLSHIARIKSDATDHELRLNDFDTTSRVYTIQTGERFLARNNLGRLLAGKIIGIMDDTRGADHDEVVFTYVIGADQASTILTYI